MAPPTRHSRRRPTRTSSTSGWRASSATAFSLPPTAFVRQVNRATAETAQAAALAEGLAPLMGWVKRLVDHVIQDHMCQPDLEFAWAEPRPGDPAAQARMLDTLVRDGIFTINEARAALGFDPVAGGEQPMIYGTAGAVPLAAPPAKEAASPSVVLRADF